jgi:hypothetical protein
MRIYFGKYRGERIEDVPDSYLVWLIEKATRIDDWLREAAVRELIARDMRHRTEQRRPDFRAELPPVSPAILAEIVAAGRRSLAFASHPDRGGDLARMQAVNVGADWLEQQLQRLMEHGRHEDRAA